MACTSSYYKRVGNWASDIDLNMMALWICRKQTNFKSLLSTWLGKIVDYVSYMNDEWGDLDFRNESNDLWVVIS